MYKKLFLVLLYLFCFCNLSLSLAQTVTIGEVPKGPYGAGSDITVPITLSGSFKKGCRFELYLSNDLGVFVSTNPIGVFDSHFTTFVNGVIPAGTIAGSGYKLQIKVIDLTYQNFITYQNSITINDATGPNIKVSPPASQILVGDTIWGYNPSKISDKNTLDLLNTGTDESIVTGKLINNYDLNKQPVDFVFNEDNSSSLNLNIGYYTVVFKSVNKDGVISTRSYVVLNSTLNLSPQMFGSQIVCIRQSNDPNTTTTDNGIITFYVDINPPTEENKERSIFTNYPGLIYHFEWGDGETDILSQYDLIDAKGIVKHQYTKSSCGRDVINLPDPIGPIYDAYSINIVKKSAIYSETVFPKTEYAKVFLAPEANFDVPGERGCVSNYSVFTNQTIPGQSQGESSMGCTPLTNYTWYVKLSTETIWHVVSYEQNLRYKFRSAGIYNIKLSAENTSCLKSEKILDICIEPDPVPDFDFKQSGQCTPTTNLDVTNKTPEEGFCKITYLWEVLDSLKGTVVVDDIKFFPSDKVRSPKIDITKPGSYILRLSVLSACDIIKKDKAFLVAGPLEVVFPIVKGTIDSKIQHYCKELPYLIDFSSNENHIPVYSGFGEKMSYLWTVAGGTEGIDYSFENSSESKKYPVIKVNNPGEYKVSVTYRNECNVPVSDNQNIIFYGPIVVNAGDDAEVCDNVSSTNSNTSFTLNANTPELPQTGEWFFVSGPAGSSFDDPKNPKAVISNLLPGKYKLIWSIKNLECAESDSMILNVYAKPEGGSVSGPTSVCIGGTGTLSSLRSVGNIIRWESSLDSLKWDPISNTADTYTFTNLQQKTYFRIVVGSKGSSCSNPEYSSSIMVLADPVSVGGSTSGAHKFCINTPTTGQILLTGNTGKIIYWEKSTDADGKIWSKINSTVNPYITKTNLNATTQFRAVVQSGECSTDYSLTTTITILPALTLADAGDDIACLAAPNYILQGNNPKVGTGMWTVDNSSIGFNDPTKFNTTATNLEKGHRYKFIWTISNGICENSSTATIDILVDIVNTIKADKTVSCINEEVNLTTLILSGGDIPGIRLPNYTFVWESSIDDGKTWNVIPGAINDKLSVTPNVTTSYRRRVKSWHSCEIFGSESTVKIVVNPSAPVATAGEDQVLCNVNTFQLQGNNPGAFVGTWNDLATGSTLIFAYEHSGTTSVSGAVPGKSYNLQWTIKGIPPCKDQTDTVKITVRKAVTIATVGAVQPICINVDNSNTHFSLTGNIPDAKNNGEKGEWSQVSGPSGAVISDLFNPVAVVSGLTAGSYVFKWIITNDAISSDSTCNTSSASVTMKVTAYPVAGTISGGNVSLCLGSTSGELTLEGYSIADSTQWQSAVGGNVFVDIPGAVTDRYQPGSPLVTTRYRVKITQADGCAISINTPEVEIKVDEPAQGGITSISKAQVCIGNNSGTILLNGHLGSVIRWESFTDHQVIWNPISFTGSSYSFTNLIRDTWFRAVVGNGSCPEAYSTPVLVEVLPNVTVADAGADQDLCNGTEIILEGNAAVNGNGVWTKVSGSGGVIENPTEPVTQVSGLTSGVYDFAWTISNGICDPTVGHVTITNYLELVNQLGGDVTVCSGQGVSNIGLLPTGGNLTYSYQWETSEDSISWMPESGQTLQDYTAVFKASTYIRRVVQSGPCSVTSKAILITVQPPLSGNVISADQAICLGDPTSKITGLVPTGGDGNYIYQWQKSIDQTNWFDIQIEGNELEYIPPVLAESTWYRRIVTTKLCIGEQKSTSNEIKVTINPLAKAEFSASTQKSCSPFDLKQVIAVIDHDEANSSYEWFADGNSIGLGKDFPGYTLDNDGEHVVIKLVANSKFSCSAHSMQMEFNTIKSVKAAFTKDQVKGCGTLLVNFLNTSSPLVGADYRWDFGNGETSNLEQPTAAITFPPHPLGLDTTYVITLTASTACQTTEFKDSVLVRSMPKVTFSPDKTTGCSPLKITFSNQSTGVPNTYTYDFGDGKKWDLDDNSEVTHIYETLETDTVIVTLTATNECGTDSYKYPIVIYPNTVIAEMVVDGDKRSGCAPYTVKFDNNSLGANNFYWDFKDGGTLTTKKAPESVSHTFTIPGTYEVSLLASNGCSSGTTTEKIIVYDIPDATFSIAENQYCVKSTVEFFSKNASATTYSWNFDDGTTSNDANPKHIFTHAGIYNVILTVRQSHLDGSECDNTSTQHVEILALPIAQFSSNSNSPNCAPFKLIVNSTPENAAHVEWNFGDAGSGDNIAVGFVAAHIFTKAGVYQVKEIAYNAVGCMETLVQTIKITARPKAEFTASNMMICGTGATINFTNQSTYEGTDAVGYEWWVDNIRVSASKDFPYTFNVPAGAIMPYKYQVKLIAKNVFGCPDVVIHTVQFNPLPKADFTTTESIACAPFTLEVQNKSQYADEYAWYLNGVLVSNEASPKAIVLTEPDQTYTLKLVSTNIYGCAPSSIEKTIRTYPTPKAIYSLAESVSCNGKLDLKITNTSLRATKYVWDFGDNTAVSTEFEPTHVYGAPGVYYLKLTAQNDFCSDIFIQTIRIAAVPDAVFVADVTKGCTQMEVLFENISVNASTYLWDFGDGSFSTSKNPTHLFSYVKSPFSIKLTAYGEFGCTDETVMTNYIQVNAPPKADFTVLPDKVIKIPDFSFTFKNTSTGNPVKQQWSFGDGKGSTEESPVHTYINTGAHDVSLTVTNAEGCVDVLTQTVQIDGVPGYLYVPNGFEPESFKNELRTFIPKGSGIATYTIKIYNKWGEQIWTSDKLDENGSPMEGWDGQMAGQMAPQGVYVWEISATFIDGNKWTGMKYKTGAARTVGSVHLIR